MYKIKKHITSITFLILVFCTFIHKESNGQINQIGPIVTDRPDVTESPEIVPMGMYQFELGYQFEKTPGSESHSFGELMIRIPLVKIVEVRAGLNSFVFLNERDREKNGLQDVSLGLKIKFLEKDHLNLALLASSSIPTGNDEFGEKKLQPVFILAASNPITNNFGIGLNLGINSSIDSGERFTQTTFSIASGYSLFEKTGLYIEYFGKYPNSKDGSNSNFVNGGMTFLINNNFQLDARFGKGLNGIDLEYFTGIGTSFRL